MHPHAQSVYMNLFNRWMSKESLYLIKHFSNSTVQSALQGQENKAVVTGSTPRSQTFAKAAHSVASIYFRVAWLMFILIIQTYVGVGNG